MSLDLTIGGPAADSYATLSEYQSYAAAMGWILSGTDATDEQNLRRAAVVNDASYFWVGLRVTVDQALQWPRYVSQDVDGFPVSSDSIPAPVKRAQMEMAYLLQGGNDPLEVRTGVVSERKKVDVIETETQYSGEAGAKQYPSVDRLVLPYTTGKVGQRAGSVPIMRA
jgi:hypothetical protein